jgi:hypothetical protein
MINNDAIVPMIYKVAKLVSDFKFGTESVRVQGMGGNKFIDVDDKTRQGNYEYTYGDSQSIVETEAKMKKLVDMLQPFADKVPINWTNLVTMMLNKLNIEDTELILQQDPIDQALGNTMPQEQKDMIKQQFVQSGMFEQAVQMMTAQMQNQGGMNDESIRQQQMGSGSSPAGNPSQLPTT